jgi:chromosome segregation ATPase
VITAQHAQQRESDIAQFENMADTNAAQAQIIADLTRKLKQANANTDIQTQKRKRSHEALQHESAKRRKLEGIVKDTAEQLHTANQELETERKRTSEMEHRHEQLNIRSNANEQARIDAQNHVEKLQMELQEAKERASQAEEDVNHARELAKVASKDAREKLNDADTRITKMKMDAKTTSEQLKEASALRKELHNIKRAVCMHTRT